jgi:hypothetical protein
MPFGIIGGIVGAIGSIGAAGIQASSAANSLDFQKQVYKTETANAAPFLEAGQGALNQLQTTPNFSAPTAAQAQAMPGYQFQLQQGEQALSNKLVSNGMTGGNSGVALENYAQGLASTNYQNAYNNSLNTYNTNLGKLQNIAGMGLSATGLANQAGQSYANNAGSAVVGGGNALASGVVGATNSATNALTNTYLANQLGLGGSGGLGNFGSSGSQFTNADMNNQFGAVNLLSSGGG